MTDASTEVATLYHERLDVYQLSIQLVASAVAISEQVPVGPHDDHDDDHDHDHDHDHDPSWLT